MLRRINTIMDTFRSGLPKVKTKVDVFAGLLTTKLFLPNI